MAPVIAGNANAELPDALRRNMKITRLPPGEHGCIQKFAQLFFN
jgi:hypothetical protein